MPETLRIDLPAERARWLGDLRTVTLALDPGRWERMRAHLPAGLEATSPSSPPGDRASRLAALAELLRSERSAQEEEPPRSETLSRSELRYLDWHPPHLAFLHRAG